MWSLQAAADKGSVPVALLLSDALGRYYCQTAGKLEQDKGMVDQEPGLKQQQLVRGSWIFHSALLCWPAG